ncbi:G protein-coupled receptor GPR1 [Kluyveromyces marxianus]
MEAVHIAAAIAGFFFLQIYDDNESHEEELDRVKSASRAGTPGPTTKNDLKNVFSNKFTYVPDDVDIEDGYNGDNNNGLHIFNYPRQSETKKATIDNSGITQPLPAHISSSSKNILSPESLSNQVPNLSNKSVNTPINWDLSEPGPKDPSGMETRTFDMDPEKLEHVPEHEVTGVKHKFQTQTYIQFKNRRDQIKRQLKSIFIYPVAYLLLWVFPFAVDCSQYRYEIYHGPIVWLAYIATFMQPLNGVVDVAVFMFREMPWRYSWACIQSKELINTYRLKGELGETVITELASSELGRRGWYYRDRWLREECWKHKPQVWKQACWYVFRFVKGLRKLNFDYEDHCLDRDFWNEYYGTHPDKNFSISTTNKPISDLKHNSSSSSGSTDCEYDPYFKKVKIPILWRIFHFFPLQEGIDLDELDRYLRTKDQLDDFVIPGLENAMNLGKANDNQIFKPNYSLTNNASLNGSQNDKPSSKRSSITAFHYSKSLDLSSIKNMDFSDVTNRSNLPGIGPGVERTNLNSTSSSREQELDLLSFLKD